MEWHFIPQMACFVEAGVTQRDQFRNDEVELYDTIVREAVQNSLDATPTDQVTHVSFRWVNSDTGLDPAFMTNLFKHQIDHARSSGLEVDDIDFKQPSALIIEDFGTMGLTGATDAKDNDNFSDFWRRHGKSHKTGTSRGRWGLGKLVYSSSSMIGAFFGMTIRHKDENKYLMGQTVLDLRTHEGKEYPPHAYFSNMVGDQIQNMMPVPSSEAEYVEEFSNQFNLTRKNEPGLSIIIPFPNETINPEDMIGVAIVNYFYPVLTDQLTLDINGTEINSKNIRELAHKHADNKLHDIDKLFDFIETANNMILSGSVPALEPSWLDDVKLAENDFKPELLEKIRTDFGDRKVVGVRLPLSVKKKSTEEVLDTEFYVFVERPEELVRGVDLYVRGGLTLPSEAKFGERKAFGAMIANDTVVSAFLGDAENPAHTKWTYNAEKLRKNYVNPGNKLKVIKHAVINFYDMLVQSEEEEDERALAKYFFTDLPESPAPSPGKPKITPGVPSDIPPSRPALARLEMIEGGFSVRKTPTAESADYPLTFRVRAAYDTVSGNPFKKYDPYDFDFTSKSGPSVGITKDTVTLLKRGHNELEFEASGPDYQIDVKGFDSNRDLVVKLNTLVVEA